MNDDELPQVLSYGGGVQTFGMLLMVKNGILPKPDFLIFSDTMAEYPETYDHIEKYAKPICEELAIPFFTVFEEGGIIEGYSKSNSIPLAGFRSCTMKYKVDPIRKKLREYLGDNKKNGKVSIHVWIGISTDESKRAIPKNQQKPKWILNTYPFLNLDMSRNQIIQYIEKSNYPLPRKSGCFICPYGGLKSFVDLKLNYPELNKIAIGMEERYFTERPDRKSGFLKHSMLKLKELNEIPSLFDFADKIPDDSKECETESCFL